MEIYVLKDRTAVFYYNCFCNHMNNIEAIKSSDKPLRIYREELGDFICKIQKRIDFNKNFSWKKKVSFN